jgi:hypothetical protein
VIVVVLSYPGGQSQDVLLSGVPRVGDRIQLRNGVQSPSLVVEQVLWTEASRGDAEPGVIVSVRSAPLQVS